MSILYKQLEGGCTIEQLKDIAGLIYDTDPYIYPSLFGDKEEAVKIFPEIILSNDNMFCYDNMYVADSDGKYIGLILWHRGSFQWNTDPFVKAGGKTKNLLEVKSRYFDSYMKVPDDMVSLINVCTSVRGKGIGKALLYSFFQSVSGPYELFVLADNKPALKLYQDVGFKITGEINGFSLDHRVLPCFKMSRVI